MNKYKSSKDDLSISDDKMRQGAQNKKFTSMWRYLMGNKTENSKTNKNTNECVAGTYI